MKNETFLPKIYIFITLFACFFSAFFLFVLHDYVFVELVGAKIILRCIGIVLKINGQIEIPLHLFDLGLEESSVCGGLILIAPLFFKKIFIFGT